MWQIIGQTKTIALIENVLKTGKVAQAYLLVGPKHIGKTTLALDFTRALNCPGEKPPCNECSSCRRIASGVHTDTMIISLDSTELTKESKTRTEISIDDIRELQRSASLPPYEGNYKIFIIDGAEYLSNEAANSLLKTLEEPPPKTVIFLLTAKESQLLPTVVSRCQRIELKPVPLKLIEETVPYYREEVGDNNDELLSRLSQGCPGWAITAATDPTFLKQRTEKLEQILLLLSSGYGQRLLNVSQLRTDRKSTEELLKFWLEWWHDTMLVKCDVKQSIINIDQLPMLEMWAQATTLLEINDCIKNLQTSLARITLNANPRLILECFLLDMPIKTLINYHEMHKTN